MRKILLLLIIGILSGCGREKINTENKLASTENKGLYFEMDNNKVDSLFQKLKTIKINDNIDTIIKILGKPDYDMISASKESNKFSFREISYYTKKINKDGVNMNDELVFLLLNAENNVYYINSNVANHIMTRGEFKKNK